MQDFEQEAYKLGIPLKTRHNEVAPSQFECAPIFEEVNIAVDHNSLLMDIMQRVAKRHKLKVLLHEKPFAGVNGSGKHNNWSLATDTGINLLAPGKTPRTNLMFLTFFVNVLKAVHTHADLLRGSIASSTNDHRLGANEAPPAIISVFVGKNWLLMWLRWLVGVVAGVTFPSAPAETDVFARTFCSPGNIHFFPHILPYICNPQIVRRVELEAPWVTQSARPNNNVVSFLIFCRR
jgi:glutamine synthetase type III